MDTQKLLSLVRQGIENYEMIEPGETVAVGISGGKDSLVLLKLMSLLGQFSDRPFKVYGITCNVGFEGMDFTEIKSFCEEIGVPYEVVDTEIAKIVFERNSDERPCSLCAKLRKGALYNRLKELGISKIAYAHHKDDFVETAIMSLIYEGRFYSFPPKTYLDGSDITVIRPMMYVPEKTVENFCREQNLPVVKNKCPVDGSTKRAYAKDVVSRLNAENSGAKDRIMHAIEAAELSDWPKKSENKRYKA